jgi:hypothetical protein
MKYEVQNVISGESYVKFGSLIQAICSHLKGSKGAGDLAEDDKQIRKQEELILNRFISERNLWVKDINLDQYVSEGAG